MARGSPNGPACAGATSLSAVTCPQARGAERSQWPIGRLKQHARCAATGWCACLFPCSPSFEVNSADNNGGTLLMSRPEGLVLGCGGSGAGDVQCPSPALAAPDGGTANANAAGAVDATLALRLAQQG